MYRRFPLLKKFLISGLLLLSQAAWAQEANELYSTAQNFIRTGDYANAILVLNQALQLEPDNIQFRKQLGFAYYLRGEMGKAKSIIDPLLDEKDVDPQMYQIAGNIYQARQEWKGAQKLYDKGIRKFPESGALYNDNGQLLMTLKMYDGALNNWLKGIEKDPNFPGNYYNAARTYYYSKDPVWAILYGEIFVNLESYTTRTAEIRDILIESYKKLFNDPSMLSMPLPDMDDKKSKRNRNNSDFVNVYRQLMAKQTGVISSGIDPEALIMLRTRFLLDWYNFYGLKYPFALFDLQQKLLKEGMFEAYNQWLFGPVASQSAYRAWTNLHKSEYDKFMQYQRNHPFKLRPDEYYNDGRFTLNR
ncbi:tetratricopeptide repeat protein [Chitinophaga japonensis]|uniref:Tetratricopeptide repeat protein n=1 Tax=Chitinophaga japonensis TaxID=104662 RepID=A0A562TF89_CHIJA|nr:tetratricopeptide repeat protein [Chitinophaga japonensis]TWI92182.1 tetratricopeptide repeat protein [Chitinophaga japonensis]